MSIANRTIVLRHATGPLAGICQILGTEGQLRNGRYDLELAAFTSVIAMGTGKSAVRLEAGRPSYVMYTEGGVPDGQV